MKLSLLCIVFGFLSACSPSQSELSQLSYDPEKALSCPTPDDLNHYIEAPVFYDLKTSGAQLAHIDELDPERHADLAKGFQNRKLRVYYEISQNMDPSKDLLMIIPGGPGTDHHVLHQYEEEFPELFDMFNVIAMDHRGLGCSKPIYPGDLPFQSMLMRYAATDIEMIRRQLSGPDGKISLIGHSYGTMLAQTYALLYPDHLNHMVLQSAMSRSEDYRIAKRKFEDLVVSRTRSQFERFQKLKLSHPDIAQRFLSWAVRPMYRFEGRTKKVPDMFETMMNLVHAGKIQEVREQLEPMRFVMPWMTRAIVCVEVFPADVLFADEFDLYPVNFDTCKEFEGHFEYFDYLDDLHRVKTPTLIVGGVFDPITTIEAMRSMHAEIPQSILYEDAHLSHSMEKTECLSMLMQAFFAGKSNAEIQSIGLETACKTPPE